MFALALAVVLVAGVVVLSTRPVESTFAALAGRLPFFRKRCRRCYIRCMHAQDYRVWNTGPRL